MNSLGEDILVHVLFLYEFIFGGVNLSVLAVTGCGTVCLVMSVTSGVHQSLTLVVILALLVAVLVYILN